MNEKSIRQISRRFLNDTYLSSEASDFIKTVENLEHINVINEITSQMWNEFHFPQELTCNKQQKYKHEALLLVSKEKKRVRKVKQIFFTAISAVSVMILIIFLIYSKIINKSSEHRIIFTEVSATHGEKKQLTLPDGSTVFLNSCSKLRYPSHFSTEKREVILNGEAYFDVIKDTTKPFIVSTNHFDVYVLGTVFNIKSYPNDKFINVNVERGKIKIDMTDAVIELNAKELITINTLSGDFIKQKDQNKTATWRKGWLRFDSTPIQDVARELERTYNCKITFQEGDVFNNFISGEHDNQSLDAVLKSIEYVSGIKYKNQNNHILFFNNE